MRVVTAAQMRAYDRWTIEHGTPGAVLMERAGAGVVRVLREHFGRRGPVVVCCGKGNNGGDGFVVARLLARAKVPVEVWLVGRPEEVRGDAALMLRKWKGRTETVTDASRLPALRQRLAGAAVVVDALLGTGLDKPVEGLMAEVVDAITMALRPVLAVDVPSGLSADSGRPLGVAVQATVTATFGLAKLGQVLHPGVQHCGALEVVDIGIPEAAFAADPPWGVVLDADMVANSLPPRRPEDHKGTFGHVLIVAGSRGKTGAALLAAEACTRSGAGLTTLAVAAALQPVVEGHVPEAMTEPLADGPDGTAALGEPAAVDRLLASRTAVVCGPGLGLNQATRALVAHLVRGCRAPLVLDADGLNAVAGTALLRERPGPTIVTPHPGEMSRLLGSPTADVQADRVAAARGLARRDGVVVVLKGARTLIADPDGRLAICPAGNPGMASGGMGDALSGILGALLAQHVPAFDAACLGVFVHAAAADAQAEQGGQVGLVASDVIRAIRPTLAALQGGPPFDLDDDGLGDEDD